jgi:hypothetical protein
MAFTKWQDGLPFCLALPSLLSVPSGSIPLSCLRLSGMEIGCRQFHGLFRAGPLLNVIILLQQMIACPDIFVTDVPAFTPESGEPFVLALSSEVSSLRFHPARFDWRWFTTMEKLIIFNFSFFRWCYRAISGAVLRGEEQMRSIEMDNE